MTQAQQMDLWNISYMMCTSTPCKLPWATRTAPWPLLPVDAAAHARGQWPNKLNLRAISSQI